MAGLQYKFFPTDFLFPRQKTSDLPHHQPQVLMARTNDHDDDQTAAAEDVNVHSTTNKQATKVTRMKNAGNTKKTAALKAVNPSSSSSSSSSKF
ncbi:OLC1v1036602C1 [Oldenlandia corymbosa var. corymbosa]|uniref:OLC1v1036602C1 n=1 Tax=Oldenlandia corymbosa var. corymbosa TaxID=529605 RepID=A0AAV1CWH7_OLDCO|nr:OLC1v1036602C1 [Oldenlandia corymbosa var. corymbosa]